VLAPYLRLARLPNVFTSMADALAGLAIARGGHLQPRDATIVAASALLYPAGMVLNDYFDRALDARERPERPIPSGQVRAGTAAVLGFGLLFAGIGAAALAGVPSLLVGSALAGAIVLYDAVAKATPAGPVVMGLCRLLNVALGLSVAETSVDAWPVAAFVLPMGLGLFTALLTLLARDEVHGGTARRARRVVSAFAVLVSVYLVILCGVSPAGLTLPSLIFAAYLLARGAAVYTPVWSASDARVIGRSIGGGILLMPAIDAAAVAASGHPLAAAMVLLLGVPAQVLKRWFAMS
jgi:4-hydroxybenzoate polyprenyltransferase